MDPSCIDPRHPLNEAEVSELYTQTRAGTDDSGLWGWMPEPKLSFVLFKKNYNRSIFIFEQWKGC